MLVSVVALGVVFNAVSLGVAAKVSCEESPTFACVIQSFFMPAKSLECTVRAAALIRSSCLTFEAAGRHCGKDPLTGDSKHYMQIEDTIEKSSEAIVKACKFDADGTFKPGFFCGARAMYAFIKLRRNIKKAAELAAIGKFENTCYANFVQRQVANFPIFQSQLNKCVFSDDSQKSTNPNETEDAEIAIISSESFE